ncbi:hypothetical protein RJT34_18043 [Clitoria ternatea]|uniref:Cwf19-like C-terminal domain-containing protein n=1 Tax=Clitoria ternatea TaxID=43366 RepID=A0AAN9JBA6_CLITE
MLPQWQPLVPGHCCILPIQHESAKITVNDNVWIEIRNFKKFLIMMFAKQEKEVVFLETVMGLAQQQRHCMVECIPLPQDIAKEAPLYFKEAIDEAEDEWSQHNAKKLIDTSQKGLQAQMEPTVESELFKALEKTRLLVGDKKDLQYSRCGRTDKGVSSVGQHQMKNVMPDSTPFHEDFIGHLLDIVRVSVSICKIDFGRS